MGPESERNAYEGIFHIPKAFERDPHHQMHFNAITQLLVAKKVLFLCRGAIGLFYSPSWQSSPKLRHHQTEFNVIPRTLVFIWRGVLTLCKGHRIFSAPPTGLFMFWIYPYFLFLFIFFIFLMLQFAVSLLSENMQFYWCPCIYLLVSIYAEVTF